MGDSDADDDDKGLTVLCNNYGVSFGSLEIILLYVVDNFQVSLYFFVTKVLNSFCH